MRRNEPGEVRAEKALRAGNHVALGAAGVRDHGVPRHVLRNGAHDGGHLANRRGKQHEIRIAHRARGVA